MDKNSSTCCSKPIKPLTKKQLEEAIDIIMKDERQRSINIYYGLKVIPHSKVIIIGSACT